MVYPIDMPEDGGLGPPAKGVNLIFLWVISIVLQESFSSMLVYPRGKSVPLYILPQNIGDPPVDPFSLWCWRQWGSRQAVKIGKQVGASAQPMSYNEAKTIQRNNFRTEWQKRLDIGTEEDSIHQLDRAAQVTIFRLRTVHCQLLSHLHRLKISYSDEWPCSTCSQTPNHILQSCPTFNGLRRQTWPSPVGAHRKLWGPVETLRQTADFALLNGLKI